MSGSDFPAGQTQPLHVSPAALGSCVEAWSGYPLQFGGMRRHGWHGELEQLVGLDWTGALFPRSPFIVKGSFIQLSPCDERCLAGEVTITPDARGRHVETSGELFTLRPRVRDTSVRATQRP